jgi:hypothetical protein
MNSISNTINYINTHRRKALVVAALGIVAAWGLFWLWDYFVIQQPVTLRGTSTQEVSFGQVIDSESGIDRVLGRAGDKPRTIRVHPGNYIAVIDGGSDYNKKQFGVTVSGPTTITDQVLSYSKAKLASILASETKTIRASLPASIAGVSYRPFAEQVYTDGTWYGAVLLPADASLDSLHVIAHRQGNNWVVTAPPQIVIPIRDYPSIPEEVIRDTNRK